MDGWEKIGKVKACNAIWKGSEMRGELSAERTAAQLPGFAYLADIEVWIYEYLSNSSNIVKLDRVSSSPKPYSQLPIILDDHWLDTPETLKIPVKI